MSWRIQVMRWSSSSEPGLPDLHFKGLAAVQHRGVQRLIKIRPGNGDVILEAPGDRAPDVMDHAECRVTIALRIGDDAHGEQIVNLFEAGFLAHDFAVHGIQTLDAASRLCGADRPGPLWLQRGSGLDGAILCAEGLVAAW